MHSHQPDIVIIDGVYLLSENKGDSANWEKLTDVSRNLKRMADGHGVPIIGVHQANRAAAGKEELDVENIAYSDALGQDADLIIGIAPESDPKELYIHCVKNRWGSPTWGFFVRLHFDTMTVRVLPDVPLKGEDDES
jgi:replicative DNA helicase